MKEIKKSVESFVTVFVANDGTEFNDKNECSKYESSAKGVLMTKYRPLVVNTTDGYSVGCGSEDIKIDIVKLKSESDIEFLLQLDMLDHTYLDTDRQNERMDRMSKILHRALSEDDYIIVGRGCDCDDSFWLEDSLNSKIEGIRKACETKTAE